MRSLVVSMLFLAAVGCLATAQQQDSYSQLDLGVKRFVDMAIIRANQQLNSGHLNFKEIGPWSKVSDRVVVDVRLRETTCRKATGANEHKHRPKCPFKPKIQVRCYVCRRWSFMETFVDCVQRKDEKTRHAIWDAKCNTRLFGTSSLILSPGYSPPETPPPDFLKDLSDPVIKASTAIPEASLPQPQGLQVFKGSVFHIDCSINSKLSKSLTRFRNSFFFLTLNNSVIEKKSGDQGNEQFWFNAADHANQGAYRCAYVIIVGEETFTLWSDPLSLTVYYFDSDDYVDDSVDEQNNLQVAPTQFKSHLNQPIC